MTKAVRLRLSPQLTPWRNVVSKEVDKIVTLGFDVSTTGAGAVLLGSDGAVLESWCWQSDSASEFDRYHELGIWAYSIQRWTDDINAMLSLSMEGPFSRGAGAKKLARAQGAVMSRFVGDWITFQPTAVKATAEQTTGVETQGSEKEPMIRAATLRWGWDHPGLRPWEFSYMDDQAKARGDVADAAWVAETDRQRIIRMRGN